MAVHLDRPDRAATRAGQTIRRVAAWLIVVCAILGAGTVAFALVERHARVELARLADDSFPRGAATEVVP